MSKDEFIHIFNAHFSAIRNYSFYLCGDIEMASDIAQEVFLRIWERQYALSDASVKPMLYKIAMSCYVSNYRKKQYHADFEKSIIPGYESSPEDEMLFNELRATYAKALEQMTERQRTVFLMNREEGMKYAEIADCLKISTKAVEKHISAAIRFLRTKLK